MLDQKPKEKEPNVPPFQKSKGKADNDKLDYVIFSSEGGMGKQIAATALLPALKRKHPDTPIIVSSSWEEPFWNNPYVYRVFKHGQQTYFYDDYVKDKKVVVYQHDPYKTTEHIEGMNLINNWHKMFNLEMNEKDSKPVVYLNQKEIDVAMQKFQRGGRPIAVVHPFGGINEPIQSWVRDMPINTAQSIVQMLLQKGYHVFQPVADKQIKLQGVEPVTLPFRDIFGLFLIANKVVGIDSFSSHLCAALDKKGLILYPSERQAKIFGYNSNDNVISTAEKKGGFRKYAYLEEVNFGGFPHEYNLQHDNMIFDLQLLQSKL
jgi:hypothetical protein